MENKNQTTKNMKKLLILLISTIPIWAGAQGTLDWNQSTRGVAIALDNQNNSYVTDYDYNPAGDISLIKRDPQGNLIWATSFNQTDNTKWERASWVETDNAGNAVVIGTLMSGYSNPVVAASIIMKFDVNGNLLWRQIFDGPFDGSSTTKCIIDATNNIYVLGIGVSPNGLKTRVKKFDATGVVLWNYFDNYGVGAPVNFKFTPDNHIVIAGRGVTGNINGYSKIDLNGNHVWNISPVSSFTVGDIAGDAFGNSYIVHGTPGSGGGTIVRKIKPNGNEIWQRNFALTAFRIEVGTDNFPVVAGFPVAGAGAAFAKINSNGNLIWLNPDADGPNILLLHSLLILDQFNNAYLAAGQLGSMAVCKVNSNGSNAWTTIISGSGAVGLEIGTDYNVYAVGGSTVRLLQTSPCTVPSNRTSSNITPTSVKLNWASVPGAVQYQVWTRKTTSTTWRKRTVPATKTFATFTVLDCGSDYVWKVRTVCNASPLVTSSWSGLENYSTAACFAGGEVDRIIDSETNSTMAVIFPNPANEYTQISFESPGHFNVVLMDISGRIIKESTYTITEDQTQEIDIRNLQSGIYLLQITSDKKSQQYRLVKQ